MGGDGGPLPFRSVTLLFGFSHSGEIQSVSDRVRDERHGLRQRLLRHGERTPRPRPRPLRAFPAASDPAVFPQGLRHCREFIVSQTPLSSTVADFWRLIWEHNAHTLVRLPGPHSQVQELLTFDLCC